MKNFFNVIGQFFGVSQEEKTFVSSTEIPKEVALAYKMAKESGKFNYDFRYIAEIDYSINSRRHRLFIYDLKSKKLETHKVAHGSGGKNSIKHDGVCREVSNVNGSHMSCLGLFKCAETYNGNNGLSLRIDGLSSTNSNARKRAIVIHGSDYVKDNNNSISGRSWGCPAIDFSCYKDIIGKLKGGSPLLSHYNGKFTI